MIANGLKAEKAIVLVDTGFTGELKLSAKAALNLNILPDRLERVELADGKIVKMSAGFAEVSMEGIKNKVEVLISDSMPTIGVGLLKRFGYNLKIDFKKDYLLLEK
jgi:clan AA aspartic protease